MENKDKSKLRILAAGDIHGDTSAAKKLADQAERENIDLVVLSGDLTYAESSTEGIIGPFVKKGKKVILIPGNHETVATADFLAELYGATNLHGYSIKYKGVGLFGCGGANIGLFQLGEDEIFELKQFLREMPEPLLTFRFYDTFIYVQSLSLFLFFFSFPFSSFFLFFFLFFPFFIFLLFSSFSFFLKKKKMRKKEEI